MASKILDCNQQKGNAQQQQYTHCIPHGKAAEQPKYAIPDGTAKQNTGADRNGDLQKRGGGEAAGCG